MSPMHTRVRNTKDLLVVPIRSQTAKVNTNKDGGKVYRGADAKQTDSRTE